MLHQGIEECVKRVGCKYTLTVMAGRRAKDLAFKQSNETDGKSALSYALSEIVDGKIVPCTGHQS